MFTDKDKKMVSMNTFIADKRLLKTKSEWNSNIQIVDSEGHLYFIKSLQQDSSLLFWESIKNVGLMVKVKAVFLEEPNQINFEDLKNRIKAHIAKNKSFWSSLDDGRGLNKMIDDTNNFEELIKMFI
ncbi:MULTISPECIES: hypothetical protein [unclassified Arcicella]|uniref:hypothetical protein n=1 Tax=unclassified Arcicella TaxID=2644986 RepID=UPI0028636FD4|nr:MULTISPECIES: hypothetical protein [unclassified Arcicella]MDR6564657.1 hypothetical protein [Arcicella sp. BE51]MDR6814415.1 hypothetical protein [Arcicella sp. BE140]MDR6825829.1 hypothetical protein [Arcicella sp. BE139]